MAGRGAAPGERRGGRKKGIPNKLTADLKEMIRGALDDAGGQAYLLKQSEENPTAFMTLLGKTVPSDVNQKLSGMVEVNGKLEFVSPKRD